MSKVEVNGVSLAYDIVGDGATNAVITPGGRYSKDTPGVRQLAEKLAEGGMRVLVWDRPNCGESDISFAGETESVMNADALAGLLRALDFGPTYLIGGSAGSRVSLLTAIRNPDVVSRLFLFWISGGSVGLATLVQVYCGESVVAAGMGGMEAVANLASWNEQVTRNPGNRQRLLDWDVGAFTEKLMSWGWAFFPDKTAPVPGLSPEQLSGLKIPAMILRSGASDMHHPRATSEALHAMFPGSRIAEPPWGDREWIERMIESPKVGGLFVRWPLLAPQILDFAKHT
jgi:pimeloyl-ACP methyl ester carboxylesterase